MSQTHSLTALFAVSAISLLFVDRFGRSFRLCHLEFDKIAMYDSFMAHSHVFRGALGGWFEELSFLWTLFCLGLLSMTTLGISITLPLWIRTHHYVRQEQESGLHYSCINLRFCDIFSPCVANIIKTKLDNLDEIFNFFFPNWLLLLKYIKEIL